MKTKWILVLILGVFFLSLKPVETKACEIEVEIVKGEKEVYNVGDTIIVLVKVSLTHRSCPVAMKKTKFKLNGMKVIKATGWKQLSSMDYERKLKIVVTGAKGGKAAINVVRECEKDGGFGSMKIKVNPAKKD